jgi:spermidine synthase
MRTRMQRVEIHWQLLAQMVANPTNCHRIIIAGNPACALLRFCLEEEKVINFESVID